MPVIVKYFLQILIKAGCPFQIIPRRMWQTHKSLLDTIIAFKRRAIKSDSNYYNIITHKIYPQAKCIFVYMYVYFTLMSCRFPFLHSLISDGDKCSAVTVGWDIGKWPYCLRDIPDALLLTAYNFQIDQALCIHWQKV